MADPNLQDFYGRVSRIEEARSNGFGFEAPGTLGRSYYSRSRKSRIPFIRPLIFLLIGVFGMKGALHYGVGSDIYNVRVERLMQGDGFDRLGGLVMQADPLTLAVSDQLRKWVPAR